MMLSFLSNLDFFKIAPGFNIHTQKKFSSAFGVATSLFIIIFSAVAFFQSDVFHKNSPTITIQSVIGTPRPLIQLSKDNYTFAIRVADDYMNLYFDPSVFTIEFNYMKTDLQTSAVLVNKTMRMKRCEASDFSSFPGFWSSIDLTNAHCMPIDSFTLEGYWDMSQIAYLDIQVRKCDNTTSSVPCQNLDYINTFFLDKYFDLLFPDNYFDLNNLQSPMSQRFNVITNKATIPFYKSCWIYMQKTLMIEDQGIPIKFF